MEEAIISTAKRLPHTECVTEHRALQLVRMHKGAVEAYYDTVVSINVTKAAALMLPADSIELMRCASCVIKYTDLLRCLVIEENPTSQRIQALWHMVKTPEIVKKQC
jgi:hypothetical protein